MINWEKERGTKNYCGWCDNSPINGSCDGACFKDANKGEANKIDHILEMLKRIPVKIEELKKSEQEYKDALKIE